MANTTAAITIRPPIHVPIPITGPLNSLLLVVFKLSDSLFLMSEEKLSETISAKLAKNSPANFLAVPSIRRAPSCASFQPTVASTL